MTLDELKAMDEYVITPKIAAQFLKCNPYSISVAALDCPERLGFPTARIGTRTKIPRIPFIRYLEEREQDGNYEYYKAQLEHRERNVEREAIMYDARKAFYEDRMSLQQFLALCDIAGTGE